MKSNTKLFEVHPFLTEKEESEVGIKDGEILCKLNILANDIFDVLVYNEELNCIQKKSETNTSPIIYLFEEENRKFKFIGMFSKDESIKKCLWKICFCKDWEKIESSVNSIYSRRKNIIR